MSELESTPGIPDTLGVSISGQANVTARDLIGGDANTATIGDGAQVGQFAQGRDITQISGITAAEVVVLLDKIRTEYQSKPFDGRSPYVGLASFQERDADKFFGRETLTAELVTRVAASAASNARALFVAGPSGSGKSSLVRAGLIPALRGGDAARRGVLLNALTSPIAPTTIAGSEHWLYETLKPGRAPLDELGLAMAKLARNSDVRSAMTTRGLTDATFLNQQADMALTDDKTQRVVLVIDQFEEIFTQLSPDRENERVAFLQQLTHAATVENGRVLVIFTLRSDFVSNCASYPNLNALVNQQFIQVGAMTPDELVSAIARPAYQVGLRIDPALISQIVNDVRGEPGALPLMQFALQDLFEAEKSKGELTLDGYTARGGLHEALERHADAEFQKLDDAEKQLARTVFSGLVEIGRGRADTKRTARFGELVPAGADAERVQALVRELADARLITTDKQGDNEIVTLAHERLIDAWDWLRKLVDENRDAIALQNEIAQDAQEWEQHKRDESYLYRGARLATAQEKLQQNKLTLSGLAQEFVETAIGARERERAEREAAQQAELERERQRAEALELAKREAEKSAAAEKQRGRILRFAIAGVSVLALLAIVAGCLAFQQKNAADASSAAAQTEAAKRGEAESTAVQDRNIAVQANETSQAANATSQAEAIARGKEADARATAEAIAIDEKNRAEQKARESNSLRIATYVNTLSESQIDLALLLAAHATKIDPNAKLEARRTLLDTLQKKPLKGILYGHRFVFKIAFSHNGKLMASLGGVSTLDIKIFLWDIESRKMVAEFKPSKPLPFSLAFSQDDKSLMIATEGHGIQRWDVETHNEITLQANGQTSSVSVAFSPDGKTTAWGKQDGSIQLWDANLSQEIAEPLKGLGIPRSLEFSPDSSVLAAGYDTGEIVVWNMKTYQAIGEPIKFGDSVGLLAFSGDGKSLAIPTCPKDGASDCQEGKIILWNVAEKKLISELSTANKSVFLTVAFNPNGETLASVGCKVENSECIGEIYLWDLATRKPIVSLQTGGLLVLSVAFNPKYKMLASSPCTKIEKDKYSPSHVSCLESPIFIYDSSMRQSIGESLEGFGPFSSDPAFSSDGTKIAFSDCSKDPMSYQQQKGEGFEDMINFWDVEMRQPIGEPVPSGTRCVGDLIFTPDNKILVAYDMDGNLTLWDVATHRQIGEPFDSRMKYANEVMPSPDSKILAVRGCRLEQDNVCQQYELSIWDLKTQKLVGSVQDHFDTITFSPDSKILAVRGCRTEPEKPCEKYELSILDLTTEKLGSELLKIQGDISKAAFSHDSKMLAYSICSKEQSDGKCIEHEIHLWDSASRQESKNPPIVPTALGDLAFDPKGKILVDSVPEAGTFLLDMKTNKLVGEGLRGLVTKNPFSPEGEGPARYPFTSDGRFLILNGRDEYYERQFLVFDLEMLQLREQLSERSLALEFATLVLSPDGRTLVSSTYNGPTQIWDMATRKQIGAPIEATGGINLRSYFSLDGNTLFSYSNTSGNPLKLGFERVMIWDVGDVAWINRACRIANRNLSFSEWEQYVKSGDNKWEDYVKNPTCPGLPVEPLATPTPSPTP